MHPECNCNYSDKEAALLCHYFEGVDRESLEKFYTAPINAYRIAASLAFIRNNKRNDYFDNSLRRCLIAIDKISDKIVYRMTREWDAMIDDRVLEGVK